MRTAYIPWTAEEDALLTKLRKRGVSYSVCVSHLPGRTAAACTGRWAGLTGRTAPAVAAKAVITASKPPKTHVSFGDLIIRKGTINVNQANMDGAVTGVVPVSISAGLERRA